MTTDPGLLDQRYGARRSWQRPVTVAVVGLVAALALGWLAWTAWYHANPDAESELVSYDVVDDHQARARLQVTLRDGAEATCRVRAFAEDRTMVGELAFTPADGVNDVVVRTERRADNVEKVGCTTEDQQRPR